MHQAIWLRTASFSQDTVLPLRVSMPDARTANRRPTALLMGAQTQIHVPLPFSARQCSGFSFNVSVSSYVRVQVD